MLPSPSLKKDPLKVRRKNSGEKMKNVKIQKHSRVKQQKWFVQSILHVSPESSNTERDWRSAFLWLKSMAIATTYLQGDQYPTTSSYSPSLLSLQNHFID